MSAVKPVVAVGGQYRPIHAGETIAGLTDQFDITAYGAVSGVSGAAAAFAAALADVPAGGGTIYIPAGAWVWEDGVDITVDNVTVLASPGALITRTLAEPIITLSGDHNAILGGRWNGNVASVASASTILLVTGAYNLIQDARAYDSSDQGIALDGQSTTCQYNVVRRCIVTEVAGVGISQNKATDGTIEGCMVIGADLEGITIDNQSHRCCVIGGLVSDACRTGGVGGVGVDFSDFGVINGLHIDGVGSSLAGIKTQNNLGVSNYNTIVGVKVVNTTKGIWLHTQSGNGSAFNVIDGCVFRDNGGTAILIDSGCNNNKVGVNTYNGAAVTDNGTTNTVVPATFGTAAGLAYDTDTTLAANSDTRIATQKAVKAYADALVQGVSFKKAVRAASTANGTLASAFENGDTLDGVTLATGDRILLKNQTAPAENGIYTVNASGAPTRATDADTGAEMVNAAVFVSEGTTLADTLWVCTTNAAITLGSTSLTFVQFGNTSGGLQASNNLSDVANPGTSRTNLGLGTAAILASDTDGTLAANSDSRAATQKATKTYVDAAVAAGVGGSAITVKDEGSNLTTSLTSLNFVGNLWQATNVGGAVTITANGGIVTGLITSPHQWLGSPGYEFWFLPGNGDLVAASSATNIAGLDSYGWTTTALSIVVGTTGDFMSSADSEPTRLDFNASADTLSSPQIFGSDTHQEVAAKFLGATPTKLCVEFRAQMYVSSANETTTFMGFCNTGVTDITAAGGCAGIVSDGTNFRLRSDNGNDAGAAIDTNAHLFRIEVSSATTEWFIDGVSQGTITTEADVWPASFTIRTGTTNRIVLMWARVYYQ